MFSIPQVLHVNFFFFSYEKGKIDAKISMVVGYFDEANGDWILEEGNDLLSGEDLTSYKYDCNKFDWLRQSNIVKL